MLLMGRVWSSLVLSIEAVSLELLSSSDNPPSSSDQQFALTSSEGPPLAVFLLRRRLVCCLLVLLPVDSGCDWGHRNFANSGLSLTTLCHSLLMTLISPIVLQV